MRKTFAALALAAAISMPMQASALSAKHALCDELAEAANNAFNDRAREWSDPAKGFYSNPGRLRDRTCLASIFSKDFDLLSFSIGSIFDSIGNQICSAAFDMTSSVGSSLDCGLYGSGIGFGLGGLGFGGKLCQNINVGGFGGPPLGVGMRSDTTNPDVLSPNFGRRGASDGTQSGGGSGGYLGGLFK